VERWVERWIGILLDWSPPPRSAQGVLESLRPANIDQQAHLKIRKGPPHSSHNSEKNPEGQHDGFAEGFRRIARISVPLSLLLSRPVGRRIIINLSVWFVWDFF